MMRAGKDYVGGTPEYEDKRSAHLLELVRNIKAQNAPAEVEQPTVDEETTEPSTVKTANQNKPTLKLTK
jgi:hypothetical protein